MTTIQQVRAATAHALDVIRAADEERSAVLATWRARLSFDQDLADATVALLLCIKLTDTKDNKAFWTFREELGPLANSYGYSIVESDTHKGVGKLVAE